MKHKNMTVYRKQRQTAQCCETVVSSS